MRSLLSTSSNARLPLAQSALPLALLLIGMSVVFLFGNDRGVFYRNNWDTFHHMQWVSSQHLTIAGNLSPSHHFLQFMSQGFDQDGGIYYDVYNRFPPGGYALIKLVTLPFEDLSDQVYAAQMLMLGLFVGTAVLAYLSLYRLTFNRWLAAAAILIAFSSTQLLRFDDTIFTEGMPDLFGFALTFHGIVIFIQDNRFRQLVLKACLALLLGWHVMALLLAFILLSSVREVIRFYRVRTVREILIAIFTSRYFILGAIALNLCILILTRNIGTEYYALNIKGVQQLAISELPSLHSILRRTGVVQEFIQFTPWDRFLRGEFRRIGFLSIPFSLPGPSVYINSSSLFNSDVSWIRGITRSQELYIGILVVCFCIVGVFRLRYRLLAMMSVLAGFCWTIPMRRNVSEHAFEGIYYIGISILFFTLILLSIRKFLGEESMPVAFVIAFSIFVLSGYQMGSLDHNGDYSVSFQKTVLDDFDTIRDFLGEKTVFVSIPDTEGEVTQLVGGARYGLHYYLSGNSIIFNTYSCDRGLNNVDFMIQPKRDKMPGLLTPGNRLIFLYDRYVYEERIDKIVEEYRPVVRGDFDVYLTDDKKLVYISDRCDETDADKIPYLGVPISLSIFPMTSEYLSDSNQGFKSETLRYLEHFVMDTERHVVIFDLPDYNIAKITTGQYYADGHRIWGGSFFGPDYTVDGDLYEQINQITIPRRPIISDHFDVYLTDDSKGLMYVREPCHNADISDDFFVHITPVDANDLPEHRRQYEFDNLDFVFVDRGYIDDRRCAVVIKLPDYDIAEVSTGQFSDRDQIWRGSFSVAVD